MIHSFQGYPCSSQLAYKLRDKLEIFLNNLTLKKKAFVLILKHAINAFVMR